jgi:ElaB/YqjD/DUF883 family membrane-anchored ribosome-binding protein
MNNGFYVAPILLLAAVGLPPEEPSIFPNRTSIIITTGLAALAGVALILGRSAPPKWSFLFPILLASLGATIPLSLTLFNRSATPDALVLSTATTYERVKQLEHELKAVSETLEVMQKQTNTSPADQPNAAIASIEQRLTQNTNAIHKFEDLLVTDASRLVTLPLMQRDFQAIKEDVVSVKDNIASLRALLTETNSQNRWVIGTLALGMLGLVIGAVKSIVGPKTNAAGKV